MSGDYEFAVTSDGPCVGTTGVLIMAETGHDRGVYLGLKNYDMFVGEPVVINARVFDPGDQNQELLGERSTAPSPIAGEVSTAVAEIKRPDGSTTIVNLTDIGWPDLDGGAGDGVAGGVFFPDEYGMHQVRVTMRGVHSGTGEAYERSAQWDVPIVPRSIEKSPFEGPLLIEALAESHPSSDLDVRFPVRFVDGVPDSEKERFMALTTMFRAESSGSVSNDLR